MQIICILQINWQYLFKIHLFKVANSSDFLQLVENIYKPEVD